jgi:hypothetical protein
MPKRMAGTLMANYRHALAISRWLSINVRSIFQCHSHVNMLNMLVVQIDVVEPYIPER